MKPLPAGSIGLSAPPRGLEGLPGRIIAWRQGLLRRQPTLPGHENLGALSHSRIALGNGDMWESTMPHARTRAEELDGIVWFAPPVFWPTMPFVEWAAEHTGDYALWKLFRFLVTGTLGPESGFVCTSGVAACLAEVCSVDVSGVGQPYNVDLRTLLCYVRAAGWQELRP